MTIRVGNANILNQIELNIKSKGNEYLLAGIVEGDSGAVTATVAAFLVLVEFVLQNSLFHP